MNKTIHLFATLFLFTIGVKAQNPTLPQQNLNPKTLLLYVEGEDYFITLIESQLRKLRNLNSEELLFEHVSNLNQIKNTQLGESRLVDAIQYYVEIDPERTKIDEEILTTIGQLLINHENFLWVKVNTLNDLIEYQLKLFPIVRSDSSDRPIIQIDSLLGSADFMIDPRKPNVDRDFKKGLQTMLPESNTPPVAIIELNYNEADPILFYETDDSLHFSAYRSFDLDEVGVEGNLSYKWLQVNREGLPITNIRNNVLNGTSDQGEFWLPPLKLGQYFFQLVVNDGVQSDTSETTRLIILEPIELEMSTPRLALFEQKFLFEKSKENEFQNKEWLYGNRLTLSRFYLNFHPNKIGYKSNLWTHVLKDSLLFNYFNISIGSTSVDYNTGKKDSESLKLREGYSDYDIEKISLSVNMSSYSRLPFIDIILNGIPETGTIEVDIREYVTLWRSEVVNFRLFRVAFPSTLVGTSYHYLQLYRGNRFGTNIGYLAPEITTYLTNKIYAQLGVYSINSNNSLPTDIILPHVRIGYELLNLQDQWMFLTPTLGMYKFNLGTNGDRNIQFLGALGGQLSFKIPLKYVAISLWGGAEGVFPISPNEIKGLGFYFGIGINRYSWK